MQTLCSDQLTIEMVGGAETDGFERNKNFFKFAHMSLPALGFGTNPSWKTVTYDGEPLVLGLRTLDGIEGLNDVHRIEAEDGRIVRMRSYCFSPETLAEIARDLGIASLPRPHRSPSPTDFILAFTGLKRRPKPAGFSSRTAERHG